jgi:hypothetical protein
MGKQHQYAETICNRALTYIYLYCADTGLGPDDLIENEMFVFDISNYISPIIEEAKAIAGGMGEKVDYENVLNAVLYISNSVSDNRADDIPALTKIKNHFKKMTSGGEIVDTFDEAYRVKMILNDPRFEQVMYIYDCD